MTEQVPPFNADQLMSAAGQAIIATDLEGTINFWNPAAERLYGWTSAEALGRRITDVAVPDMTQLNTADIMAVLREGRPWAGGFSVQRRDGSVFPAFITVAAVYDDRDEMIGTVGVSTNVGTALRPLLERSSDAALVLTTEGIVRYASPAVEALFGLRPEDLIGKSFRTFIDVAEDDVHRILHQPGPRMGDLIEATVYGGTGPTTVEAAVTDLRDDPVLRGVVCNLRRSERLTRLRERERISRAAHADVLQTLFSATLDVAAAQGAASPAEQDRLESAGEKIREAIGTLRALVAPDTKAAVGLPPVE
jgi:PAS domain S-box-containing protein